MKEWIKELCPNIEDWQAELIAEHAQPQREWVDLSDELIDKTSWDFTDYEGFQQGARWAQTKLKELNT